MKDNFGKETAKEEDWEEKPDNTGFPPSVGCMFCDT